MDEIQVVMVKPVREAFEEWLHSRGLRIFMMPAECQDQDEDAIPIYGVTFSGR